MKNKKKKKTEKVLEFRFSSFMSPRVYEYEKNFFPDGLQQKNIRVHFTKQIYCLIYENFIYRQDHNLKYISYCKQKTGIYASGLNPLSWEMRTKRLTQDKPKEDHTKKHCNLNDKSKY